MTNCLVGMCIVREGCISVFYNNCYKSEIWYLGVISAFTTKAVINAKNGTFNNTVDTILPKVPFLKRNKEDTE